MEKGYLDKKYKTFPKKYSAKKLEEIREIIYKINKDYAELEQSSYNS